MKRSSGKSPRSGTTLVEILVVITIAGVMLGVSVETIHRLLEAEHEAVRSVRFDTSLARLAQAFRSDIHACRKVELPAPDAGMPVVLVAEVDDLLIRYELDAHLARRIETERGREVHRENYYFPPKSRLRFEHDPGDKLVLLEQEFLGGS